MPGLFSNPRLALEQVEFQDGSFFRELTAVFASLRKLKVKQVPDSGLYETLSTVIRKHTNLNVVTVDSPFGPAIQVPPVDRNHPLVHNHGMKLLSNASGKELLRQAAGGQALGEVNLRTGRVGGFWAELPASLLMPATLVSNKELFTPEELAAITLHEVGHYFVYCEFLTHTLTTNAVLQEMTRELDGTNTLKERQVVLLAVKDALKLKDLDAQLLAQTRNGKVIQAVVLTSVEKRLRSELGSSIYDFKGFEALADQYASRQGGGAALATALDKMHRAQGDSSYLSLPVFLLLEAIKLVLLLSPFSTLLMMVAGGLGMHSLLNAPHETPQARTKRLRNDVVHAMKNPKLSDAAYKALKADLDVIDQLAAAMNDRRTLFQTVATTLAHKDQWDQMTLQKQLEALATNDLFVKAQELKHLDLK